MADTAEMLTEARVLELINELQVENGELEADIRGMHARLVEMGDPDEPPIPHCELHANKWLVEGYDGAHQTINVTCQADQEVEILHCSGGNEFVTVHVKSCAKRVLIANCSMVKVIIDVALFGVEMVHCRDSVVVVAAEPPKIVLKHCVAIGLLLSHDRMDGKIELAHSAGVVLSSPLRASMQDPTLVTVDELEKAEHFVSVDIPSYVNCSWENGNWSCALSSQRQLHRESDPYQDEVGDIEADLGIQAALRSPVAQIASDGLRQLDFVHVADTTLDNWRSHSLR